MKIRARKEAMDGGGFADDGAVIDSERVRIETQDGQKWQLIELANGRLLLEPLTGSVVVEATSIVARREPRV